MKDRCIFVTDILSIVFILSMIILSFFINHLIKTLDISYMEKIGKNWNTGIIESLIKPSVNNLCLHN